MMDVIHFVDEKSKIILFSAYKRPHKIDFIYRNNQQIQK